MESVKVNMTEKLQTLFEQGNSLGCILFTYDLEQQKYTGQIQVPHDQALLWHVPDFLRDVPASNIHIELTADSEGGFSVFSIQIGHFKNDSDPQQFDMEIRSSPASSFNELDLQQETVPESE